MKKKLQLIGLTLFSLFAFGSLNAQVFIVENASKTSIYDNLEDAVNAAQDGDNVYLPGGTHEIKKKWTGYDGISSHANTLAVTKRINWIGGGYAEGASIPKIVGTVIFLNTASGSTITGTYFDKLNWDNTSNMTINRCYVAGEFQLSGVGNNNLIVENSLYAIKMVGSFNGSPSNSSPLIVNIVKNIFRTGRYYPLHSLSGASIRNNMFLGADFVFFDCTYCTAENNILVNGSSLFYASYCSFRNNLLVSYFDHSTSRNNSLENNIERVDVEDIFVDYAKGDYHLKETSPGKNMGTDGTDVGIYGTDFPFKDSKLPAIPYFKKKNVAPETDVDQKLKVNIEIEAQDR